MTHAEFKIYATADLHGHLDRLSRITDNVISLKPDVLVIAGDITSHREHAAYIRRLNDLPVPVLTVRGNMDVQNMEEIIASCSNVTSLHLREATIAGVRFVGMGGTIPVPFRSRICLREQQMIAEMDHLIREDCVLVAHPPPYGALDEGIGNLHAGSKGLRRLLSEKLPKMLICGHIHEKPGWAIVEKTLVVNCSMGQKGAGALITLIGDAMPTVRML